MNIFRRLLNGLGNFFYNVFNTGIRVKYVVAVLVIFTGGAIGLTYTKMLNDVGGSRDFTEAKRYIELKDVIEDKYIDTVDRDSMADSASAAIVSGLGDKWSYYMTEDEYQSYQLYSANDYSDVGMTMVKDESGNGFEIITVVPGTPAGNSGLEAGMVISSIAGEDIRNSDIDEVRRLIRSHVNEAFEVGVDNDRETYTVDCSLTYESPVTYRLEKTNAGYVQISSFEAGTGVAAMEAIEDLLSQKAEAIVIDVRNNPGGLDSEVGILLDYLLPSGDLFSLVDKQGNKVTTKSDAMSLQMPMIILINEDTYAEAEVFAQVIKDYQWAILLGEPTSGMTRIQETYELSDNSAVHLSTKAYLSANGTDIAAAGGVIPDMIVHNSDASATGTTEGTTGDSDGTAASSDDEQLMAALKYLS